MDNPVFNEDALERVKSPEALDEYVRVARPGVWLTVAMIFVLAASLCVWGFTGTLPETLTVNGALYANGEAVCYVSAEAPAHDIVGCSARVVTATGQTMGAVVTSVSVNPLSRPEIAASQPDDWMAEMLSTNAYAYAVVLSLDSTDYTPNTIASVTLIVAEVKPISFLL
jgi:hypothetical protein